MKKNKLKLVTLGILFTLATGIIYLINRLIFASATLKDLLKSSANNYYNWRFGKIYIVIITMATLLPREGTDLKSSS